MAKVLRDFSCSCGNKFESWAQRNGDEKLEAECPKCGKKAPSYMPTGKPGPAFRFNYMAE